LTSAVFFRKDLVQAMTEKTFRDKLPLTDEQRNFLRNENSIEQCGNCFLALGRNGTDKLCGDYVFGAVKVGFSCRAVRVEAIRLDDEYRRTHMVSKIMGQKSFDRRVNSVFNDEFDKCSSALAIKKGYATAIERISVLENELAERDGRISILEKDNTRLQELYVDSCNEVEEWQNATGLCCGGDPGGVTVEMAEKYRDSQDKKITELESRLAAYEPGHMDTREEAFHKAEKYALEKLRENAIVNITDHKTEFTVYYSTDGELEQRIECFPCAELREFPLSTVQFGGPPKQINTIKLPPCLKAKWDGEGTLSVTVTPSYGYAMAKNGSIVPV
jgi:hypothetical protein